LVTNIFIYIYHGRYGKHYNSAVAGEEKMIDLPVLCAGLLKLTIFIEIKKKTMER
jgi:hypothetical protein